MIVVGRQTRTSAYGTVDVEGEPALTADQMVVIVAHAGFVTGRRASRLNAAEQIALHQHSERVVHRLTGDRADDFPNIVGQFVGRDVRSCRNRLQNGHPLSGDLKFVLAKKLFGRFHEMHTNTNSGLGQEFVYLQKLRPGGDYR